MDGIRLGGSRAAEVVGGCAADDAGAEDDCAGCFGGVGEDGEGAGEVFHCWGVVAGWGHDWSLVLGSFSLEWNEDDGGAQTQGIDDALTAFDVCVRAFVSLYACSRNYQLSHYTVSVLQCCSWRMPHGLLRGKMAKGGAQLSNLPVSFACRAPLGRIHVTLYRPAAARLLVEFPS